MADLTIDECQAILEKNRKWLYNPPGYQGSESHFAAHELASGLAAALSRNERIARARNRNQGFARLYREKALAYQREIEDMKGELRVLAEKTEEGLRS